MTTIILSKYGHIISDRAMGEEVYEVVKHALYNNKLIAIDFTGVRSMATYNAKQIFGRLYIELGSETFFERIELKNVSSDLKLIIRMGIQSALEEETAA